MTKATKNKLFDDIKNQLNDLMGIGRLFYDRQNAGSIPRKRNIRLCRPGTADFIVLKLTLDQDVGIHFCRVVYLEVKEPDDTQSDDQKEFQRLVEAQGAEYYVVRDVEQVMEIVG